LWVGPSSRRSTALNDEFRLTGSLATTLKTVAAVPDGVVLNTAAPENVIHANLSATRNDDSFYDLAKIQVAYHSSDPSVASVDAKGIVHPVSAGAAQITATVSVGTTSKSTTFPVVVYEGQYTADGVTLFDRIAQFGDRDVSLPEARAGVHLHASVVPASDAATYTFATALNETNSADATITPDGVLRATKPGVVRATVVADVGGTKFTHTATITIGYSTSVSGDVSGTVPPTLSLSLGAPASFGAFVPGVARDYTASTTANIISTAGNAALTVSAPGHLANGAFSLPEPLVVDIAPSAWSAPVSNATAAITFHQHIGAGDALRTGSYTRTLTFTLSTTQP
jgi:hypothetical protein